jgi:hypothetical protein
MRGRGFSAKDTAVVAGHERYDARSARESMPAPAGTHAHAEELRQLAREAGVQAGGAAIMREGISRGDYLTKANLNAMTGTGNGPDVRTAPHQNALNRAAQMIDAGQPGLAREHAQAIREGAAAESSVNPRYAARLSAAADKLESLPASGLAVTPPGTAAEAARTTATRRYAAMPGGGGRRSSSARISSSRSTPG